MRFKICINLFHRFSLHSRLMDSYHDIMLNINKQECARNMAKLWVPYIDISQQLYSKNG